MSEPRTETIDPRSLAIRPTAVRVLVTSGPDAGRSVTAEDGTVLIGSQSTCQLQLSDPATSRRHCSAEVMGSRVRVRDLGSKNGTLYLGAKVTSVDVPLGGSIEVGRTVIVFLPVLREGVLAERETLAGLVGRSTAMRRLFSLLEQVAPTDSTVLVTGETGSGKEAVARAIHSLSERAKGPFVTFDCGSTAVTLVQSVLFGHLKGAFTGAVRDTVGLVESAHGGTLVLDEVSELPLELQPVLLRVLETRTFQRLGDAKPRASDFRLVALTTQDLPALIAKGRFRGDLYYRLSAITLAVPPLRQRAEDIGLLAKEFLKEGGSEVPLSPGAVAALSAYRWPGNVRELRNAVMRVSALGEGAVIAGVAGGTGGAGEAGKGDQTGDFHAARARALSLFEKSYLEALLAQHNGSAAAAARAAGIARSYLYKMLEEHGIDPDKWRGRG